MILEGIVTTVGGDGRVSISPMGPLVTPDMRRLTLRPFKTSQTYANLKRLGEGVFHVTDDVELLARAAVSSVEAELRPATSVRGFILAQACRAYEFRVARLDDREERVTIEVDVVRCERLRDYFGLNRAKHAVVEAAILATRLDFLALDEVAAEIAKLGRIVQKTGGPAEHRAFHFLERFVDQSRREREMAAASEVGSRGSVRIQTGSRLHFGLIAPGEGSPRRFGGAGVMVARPGIDLTVEMAPQTDFAGPLAERALDIAVKITGESAPRCRLRVLAAPPEHVGLGTGTQLGMAVAQALAALHGEAHSTAELARRAGRGRRSSVGVHGFERGGFLVDGGKRDASDRLAPLSLRLDVPAEWRFVLATPRGERGLSGGSEAEAFRALDAVPEAAAQALSHVLLTAVVPALAEADLQACGEALYEYGVRAGECFRASQGDVFASAAVADIVRFVRSTGAAGAGQSSWGPTVWAVAEDEGRARDLARRLQEHFGRERVDVLVTAPLNRGATVVSSASPPEDGPSGGSGSLARRTEKERLAHT